MEIVPCVPVNPESAVIVVLPYKVIAAPKLILSPALKVTAPPAVVNAALRARLLLEPAAAIVIVPGPVTVIGLLTVMDPPAVLRFTLSPEAAEIVPLSVMAPLPATDRVRLPVELSTVPELFNEPMVST